MNTFHLNIQNFENVLPYKNIEKQNIGLAISGGIDSMVLADLLIKSGFEKIVLLHVNYGLRHEDSDKDELFVRDFALKKNLRIEVLNAKNIIESAASIQEKARKIRYQWFQNLFEEGIIDKLFTAHHQNDVVETFLINIFRKTGLKGLSGIHDRDFIIRPLIKFNSKDIHSYAIAHKIEWREDSSNHKTIYARNRIRLDILPAILKSFPDTIQNIAETALHIRNEELLQKELIEQIRPILYVANSDDFCIINLEKLAAFSQKELLLFHLIAELGFNRNQCSEMIQAYKLKNKGVIWASNNFDCCISANDLIFIRKNTFHNHFSFDFKHVINKIELHSNFFIVSISKHKDINCYSLEFPNDFGSSNLQIRFWKKGDRIKIKGGSKKISDVFNEAKIPILFRPLIPLITLKYEVIWIPGIKLSDAYEMPKDNKLFLNIKYVNSHFLKQ